MAKKEIAKVEEQNIANIGWNKMYEDTPKEYIKKREGRGGRSFDYVETGYIIKRLNEVFNYLWDFEIVEEKVYQKIGQVSTKGKLTVHLSPTFSLSKVQYGSSVVKMGRDGKPLSIGDDLKASASDCLKKCASLFGIASDVYWGGEVEDDTTTDSESKVDSGDGFGENSDSLITPKQLKYIQTMYTDKGLNITAMRSLLKAKFNKSSHKELTSEEASRWIKEVQGMQSKKSLDEELDDYFGNNPVEELNGELPEY